jgi:hypothetical protein
MFGKIPPIELQGLIKILERFFVLAAIMERDRDILFQQGNFGRIGRLAGFPSD